MDQRARGIIAIFFSTLFFGIMSLLVKKMPGHLSGQTIAFFRFTIGIVLTVAAILITGKGWKTYDRLDVLLRGLFGSVSMVFYFMAIQMGSSGRATLLNRTAPFFVALWGVTLFKKKLFTWQILLILFCFGGVILLFYDGSTYPLGGDILALLSAALLGLGMHYVHRARVKNHTLIIYLVLCIMGAVITAPMVEFARVDLREMWPWLTVMGAVSWLAQILFSWAFKYISALEGSMISYLHIPFTVTGSVLLLGETMTPRFFIGMGVILAGLFVYSWLEQKRQKKEDLVNDEPA